MIVTIGVARLLPSDSSSSSPRCTSIAPPAADIKASAQNLLIFIIYDLGSIAGSVLSGYLRDLFKHKVGDVFVDDWTKIWAGPLILTLVSMAAFAIFFKEEELRKPEARLNPELAA